jgi:hypothetical protein
MINSLIKASCPVMVAISLMSFTCIRAHAQVANGVIANAPSIKAEEIAYGLQGTGDNKVMTETIAVTLVDLSSSIALKERKSYQVQCYFFVEQTQGAAFTVHDAVAFDVQNLNVKYTVESKNISVPPPPKPVKTAGKAKAKPAPKQYFMPRFAGYCIEVLEGGKVLDKFYSSESIKHVVDANPGVLSASPRRIEVNASTSR